MKKYILLLLVLLVISIPSRAQQKWISVGTHNNVIGKQNINVIGVDSNGYIYTSILDSSYPAIIRWDGNKWTKLGSLSKICGSDCGEVYSICFDKNGNVFATGNIMDNTCNHDIVVKWDGKSWSKIFDANYWGVDDGLAVNSDGKDNIYISGRVEDTSKYQYVLKYDGKTFTKMGNSKQAFGKVCVDNKGNVYSVGGLGTDLTKWYVLKWDGTQWSEVKSSKSSLKSGSYVSTICTDTSGNLYATGDITDYIKETYQVAKWNGVQWLQLDTLGTGYPIRALTSFGNNIYTATGYYDDSTIGYEHDDISYWNGNRWGVLGGNKRLNPASAIFSIIADKYGNIFEIGSIIDANQNTLIEEFTSGSSGIAPMFENSFLKIYPSPTTDFLNISISDPKLVGEKYFVYNENGQQVYSGIINAKVSVIDMHNFISCLYFLRFNSSQIEPVKFIKQ